MKRRGKRVPGLAVSSAPVVASNRLPIGVHRLRDVDGEVMVGVGAAGIVRVGIDGLSDIEVAHTERILLAFIARKAPTLPGA